MLRCCVCVVVLLLCLACVPAVSTNLPFVLKTQYVPVDSHNSLRPGRSLSLYVVSRQARAAANRAAFNARTQDKARSVSDRVANAQAQKQLMTGDDNHFTVLVARNTDAQAAEQGWAAKPSLPNRLQQRLATLKIGNQAATHFERQARAAANRAAFLANIAKKAHDESEKLANATSRRAVAQGDGANGCIFSVGAGAEEKNDNQSGWGAAKPLPARLSARLQTLKQAHAPKPHAERTAAAAARRAAFQASIAAKAAAETDKIANAASRRALATGDANTFTVAFAGAEEDAAIDAKQGWNQTNRLPTRLSERLNELGAQFGQAPFAERQAQAGAKRAAFLAGVAAKASAEADKVSAAQSRRALAAGDDTHFTVAGDDDVTVQERGWGYKPPMPARLSKRLSALRQQFKPTAFSEREARADANRAAHLAAIQRKAGAETDKVMNAQSRRAVVVGNENSLFTVDASEEANTAEAKATGWGVPVPLPKRLAARVSAVRSKFASKDNLETRQRKAAANRAAHYAGIQGKAHASSERMLAVHSRKQLVDGNAECFRVEFNGEETETKTGWGPGSPTLPKRLARRAAGMLRKSPQRNPFEAMNRAAENRDQYLAAVIGKARQTAAKMQAARERKLKHEMDSGIILLNTANQRALSPVKLPQRLSERVEALTTRFGYDGAEREKRVAENRVRRIAEIRSKAAAASQKIAMARERRAQAAKQQRLDRMSGPAPAEAEAEEKTGVCERSRNGCVVC